MATETQEEFKAPPHHPCSKILSKVPAEVIAKLQKNFKEIDADKSNSISKSELVELAKKTLANDCTLNDDTADKLIKAFDYRESGQIDFYEFVAVYVFIQTTINFFREQTDGTGELNFKQTCFLLYDMHIGLDDNTIVELFNTFREKQQGLNLDRFIKLCSFLGLAKRQYFLLDPMNYGSTKLDLESFLDAISFFATSRLDSN
eukprot:TRINITY_DN927_c3_g1_i1.p1 TRINITY_DN927_c3_g1~~TRINITY_DN927_c3_g1_i1.p1  ORF type:complete len:219 (-),score=95.90 TRINITY_DN927_c3_g1_i1:70-678(-)